MTSPSTPIFALVSESPRVTYDNLVLIAAALRAQMIDDLAPAYEAEPWTVLAYEKTGDIPAGAIAFKFVEVLDDKDAIAYHTEDKGVRYGLCGVAVVLDNGGTMATGSNSLSSAASHEMCETYADASISTYADMGDGGVLAYENCDPVESDFYTKKVESQDVAVSNFVFPSYFDPDATLGTQFDQMKLCTKPGELREGGYQVRLHASHSELVSTQVFGKAYPEHKKKAKGHIGTRGGARIHGHKPHAPRS